MGPRLEDDYGIPPRRLTGLVSPWCRKRLDEFGGDISRFKVVRLMPSRLRQFAIAQPEPGDENTQDIPSQVRKVDIRTHESPPPNEPHTSTNSGAPHPAPHAPHQ